jgi:hypothetical protein
MSKELSAFACNFNSFGSHASPSAPLERSNGDLPESPGMPTNHGLESLFFLIKVSSEGGQHAEVNVAYARFEARTTGEPALKGGGSRDTVDER